MRLRDESDTGFDLADCSRSSVVLEIRRNEKLKIGRAAGVVFKGLHELKTNCNAGKGASSVIPIGDIHIYQYHARGAGRLISFDIVVISTIFCDIDIYGCSLKIQKIKLPKSRKFPKRALKEKKIGKI